MQMLVRSVCHRGNHRCCQHNRNMQACWVQVTGSNYSISLVTYLAVLQQRLKRARVVKRIGWLFKEITPVMADFPFLRNCNLILILLHNNLKIPTDAVQRWKATSNTLGSVWALHIHPLTVMETDIMLGHMILLDKELFTAHKPINYLKQQGSGMFSLMHLDENCFMVHLKRTWQSQHLWNVLPVVRYWNIHGRWKVRAVTVGFSPWAYHPSPPLFFSPLPRALVTGRQLSPSLIIPQSISVQSLHPSRRMCV